LRQQNGQEREQPRASPACATEIAAPAARAAPPKYAFLDALRGVLALMVTVTHILVWAGFHPWPWVASFAVDGFFVLSGYVLAQSYQGAAWRFFARRAIRLWPVFALTMLAGYALHDTMPSLGAMLWLPGPWYDHLDIANKPAWSLFIEVWLTPLIPFFILLARRRRQAALLLTIAILSANLLLRQSLPHYGALLAAGIAAAQYKIIWPAAPFPAAWFGRQAYSLYLTNWLVLSTAAGAGRAGVLAAIPLVFIISWAMWHYVEKPSVALARRIG
jgi:peptidoglycan/LPS O-acetylase OafA/YrhL